MSDRLPRVGASVRILAGASGTAEDFVGQVVLVSDTLEAGRYRDDIVFFWATESYAAPLTRDEWELAPLERPPE